MSFPFLEDCILKIRRGNIEELTLPHEDWFKARKEMCDWLEENAGHRMPFVSDKFADDPRPHFLLKGVPVFADDT